MTAAAASPKPAPPPMIIGLEPRALTARALGDASEDVRAACLGTVLSQTQHATPLREALAARLADDKETEDNRILAAHCLGHVKPLPAEALSVGLARKQGPKVRTAAATALIAPKGEAAGASAALAKCLLAGDNAVRGQSVLALRNIGGLAVPHIVGVVEQAEKFDITRMAGMDALGFIGGEAEPALPLAERLAKDAPPTVMACARFAVASIKSADTKAGAGGDGPRGRIARPLLDMFEHEDEKVRLLAIERVGWLRHGLPAAGDSFVGLLTSGSPAEREAAALGLARSRTPTDKALDPLLAGLKDVEPGVRKACCIALSAYGSDAKPALEPMLELVKNKTEVDEVRRSAGECAKAIVKAEKGPYWM